MPLGAMVGGRTIGGGCGLPPLVCALSSIRPPYQLPECSNCAIGALRGCGEAVEVLVRLRRDCSYRHIGGRVRRIRDPVAGASQSCLIAGTFAALEQLSNMQGSGAIEASWRPVCWETSVCVSDSAQSCQRQKSARSRPRPCSPSGDVQALLAHCAHSRARLSSVCCSSRQRRHCRVDLAL